MLVLYDMNGTHLSPRQREVLSLCARNLSREEIAQELGISPNTVDSHLRKIYIRLKVRSRVEAIVVALFYQQLELGRLAAALGVAA